MHLRGCQKLGNAIALITIFLLIIYLYYININDNLFNHIVSIKCEVKCAFVDANDILIVLDCEGNFYSFNGKTLSAHNTVSSGVVNCTYLDPINYKLYFTSINNEIFMYNNGVVKPLARADASDPIVSISASDDSRTIVVCHKSMQVVVMQLDDNLMVKGVSSITDNLQNICSQVIYVNNTGTFVLLSTDGRLMVLKRKDANAIAIVESVNLLNIKMLVSVNDESKFYAINKQSQVICVSTHGLRCESNMLNPASKIGESTSLLSKYIANRNIHYANAADYYMYNIDSNTVMSLRVTEASAICQIVPSLKSRTVYLITCFYDYYDVPGKSQIITLRH